VPAKDRLQTPPDEALRRGLEVLGRELGGQQ
jgi:hypothetical protein